MRLSPTLSLYIVRQFLLGFLVILVAIMGLILVFDLIELIRRAGGRPDLGFGALLAMALLKLPQMTHTILPFAVMIGGMVAFWRLTRTNELVIARAAGVSVWQILAPVMIAVLAMGVIEMTAFNPLAAVMFSKFTKMQDELLLNRANALDVSEVGLWLREGLDNGKKDGESGQVVFHADDVRQEGLVLNLKNVHVFVYDHPDHFDHRIAAASAQLVKGAFEMQDVWTMWPGKPGTHLDTLSMPTQLTLERVHDNFASPETLSFWQLPGFISFFERAGFSAPKHRMYLQSLIASPALYCGMVLLAALFSLKPNTRSGGLVTRVAAGVSSGFVLYFFSKIVYALGLSQTVPQFLAAWAPAMMTGLAGIGLLFHLEDG